MSADPDRIAALTQSNIAEIAACDPSIISDFPVARYLRSFDVQPKLAPYHAVPVEAQAIAGSVLQRGGAAALEAYNRLVLLALIGRGSPGSSAVLTDELKGLLDAGINRILSDIAAPRKGFHLHSRDQFAKDFAVCRGRMIPGGVELIELAAGIGRSILFKGGLAEVPSRLYFFRFRMRGFRTFFALHFDRRMISEFNNAGFLGLHLRLADLLERNPRIGGVVSASWWHDPVLETISPELLLIDRNPRMGGARVMRMGEDDRAKADATRMSPHRAALCEQGLYRPCVHLLAWPRRDLLAWARRQRQELP